MVAANGTKGVDFSKPGWKIGFADGQYMSIYADDIITAIQHAQAAREEQTVLHACEGADQPLPLLRSIVNYARRLVNAES